MKPTFMVRARISDSHILGQLVLHLPKLLNRPARRVAVPCGWSCSRNVQSHVLKPMGSSHALGATQSHLREMWKRQGTDARRASMFVACSSACPK